MEPNAYGVVKAGKIQYKYGFIPVDAEFLPVENNAENTAKLQAIVVKLGGVLPATFPTEGTSWDCGNGIVVMYRHPGNGSGKVNFEVKNDMIRSQISEVKVRKIVVTADITLTNVADVVWEYLDKHWQAEKTVTQAGSKEIVKYNLRGNDAKKKLRGHVWGKYQEWVKEVINTKFTVSEDDMPCGVSLYDIVMRMFIGNDYPLQPVGLDRPMKTAEIVASQNGLKSIISTQRQALESKCFMKPATATESEWQTALGNVASWVLTGELLA